MDIRGGSTQEPGFESQSSHQLTHVTLSIIFPIWALILASLKCAEAKRGSFYLTH